MVDTEALHRFHKRETDWNECECDVSSLLDILSKWETKYGAAQQCILFDLTRHFVWTSHGCTGFIPLLLFYYQTTFGSVFCILLP